MAKDAHEPLTVFADTAFFVAIMNRRDALHDAALEWAQRPRLRLVSSEYVLIELANFLAKSNQHRAVAALFSPSPSQPLTIVAGSKTILRAALGLYSKHDDKAWSLTDCTSMAIMKRQRLRRVLTPDHHFKQAGFETLL
ncbi:MAG: PIN domain-containing protein [Phycisphaerales bacterium]|jgi:hypothetical protein